MVRHFHRLRMRTFAAALRQHSRREMLQTIRFQYSLLQLGNELKSSDQPCIAAGDPLELNGRAIEVVPHSLAPKIPRSPAAFPSTAKRINAPTFTSSAP